jgi:hypothetical protein
MKNQKIVEIEDGKIITIWNGTSQRGFPSIHHDIALGYLFDNNGTDWQEHIKKLEKVIIGCSRRHPEDKEYFKEMMPNCWFENMKNFYSNTNIKTRTEKEKQELVDRIISDKY